MAQVPEDKAYQGMVDDDYWIEEVIEYGLDGDVHKIDVPEMEVFKDEEKEVASTTIVKVMKGRHGLGLYALEFIENYRQICEYSGQLIIGMRQTGGRRHATQRE